jgi:protein SCO1
MSEVPMQRKWIWIAILFLLGGRIVAAETYAAKGLVVKVDAPHRTVLISCEKIPGFMEAMVMPFEVRDSKELASVAPGAMIEFTLVVDSTTSYIEKIHVHHYQSVEQDPMTASRLNLLRSLTDASTQTNVLKPGEQIPDFTLIDQTRNNVSPSQFRGKVVLITFTYTHCALPNFCFRIANNFRRIQTRFANDMGRDLVFMSITFDPAHDTPDVMASYGKTWKADPANWKLLTGSSSDIAAICGKFGVTYFPDEGLMNHSLHTFVVDRDGKLVADMEGNEYSAEQLGDLVQSVLGRARTPVHTAARQ